MKRDFIVLMGKSDHAYYPLRFIASSFFTPYWSYFVPDILEPEEIKLVQKAAKNAVDESMGGEKIYWIISFDEDKAIKIWQNFFEKISALSQDKREIIRALCAQIAVSGKEKNSADYLVNLIVRLRFNPRFREFLNYAKQDKEILDAVYEQGNASFINDMPSINEAFLRSTDPWDVKLRNQTPYLPESLCVIFSSAYQAKTDLPLIQRNLRILLSEDQSYHAFIKRLKIAFQRSLAENTAIKFPDNFFC